MRIDHFVYGFIGPPTFIEWLQVRAEQNKFDLRAAKSGEFSERYPLQAQKACDRMLKPTLIN